MEQNLRGPGKVLGKEGMHFKGKRRAGALASTLMSQNANGIPLPSHEGMTDTIEMHDLSAREQNTQK